MVATISGRATFPYNLRFPGQYYMAETGLNYNYHRDYDPLTAKYVESDPFGLRGGINTYAYVEDDPLDGIDPTGRIKIHGNWCGPDWTGGFKAEFNQLTPNQRRNVEPPIDPVDAACEKHDKCYAHCRERFPCSASNRVMCFSQCDLALLSTVYNEGFWGRVVGTYFWYAKPDPGKNAPNCPQCGKDQ